MISNSFKTVPTFQTGCARVEAIRSEVSVIQSKIVVSIRSSVCSFPAVKPEDVGIGPEQGNAPIFIGHVHENLVVVLPSLKPACIECISSDSILPVSDVTK